MSLKEILVRKSQSSSSKPLLLDGALGTLLPEESQNHALWSTHSVIKFPEIIKDVHKQYIEKGCDMLITSTYQTSEAGVKRWFPELKYADVVRKSIDIAYEALVETNTVGKVFIVGSIGPYGASLANGSEYTGDYGDITDEELFIFHKEMVDIMCEDDRIDIVALETIPNLQEVKILTNMMKQKKKLFYLGMSIRDRYMADGITTVDDLIPVFSKISNLAAVGVNCVGLVDSLKWMEMLKASGQKLVVYPNSGEVFDKSVRRYLGSPEKNITWEQYIRKLKENGDVLIVGGCCRTDPSVIGKMRKVIDELYD